MASTEPPPPHKYELIFIALYISQTTILDYSCLQSSYLTIFFSFDRKRYFEAQTTAPEGLHAIIYRVDLRVLIFNTGHFVTLLSVRIFALKCNT